MSFLSSILGGFKSFGNRVGSLFSRAKHTVGRWFGRRGANDQEAPPQEPFNEKQYLQEQRDSTSEPVKKLIENAGITRRPNDFDPKGRVGYNPMLGKWIT